MIITFVLIGKYLEVIGKKGAVDAMDSIKSYIPLEATIIIDDGKKVISLDDIQVGDIIEVKNGEKASVDGEVISGNSSFDESSLTGESIPIIKNIGDKIFSGTINTNQVIRYKALKNYANSTLNHIVELLEDSLSSKPQIEDTTNELSKYFSVIILALAIFGFFGWYYFNSDFENSLIIAISVIVIACPCALALATPIASLIGVSWLSKEGLLFKEAKFIQTVANTSVVVFDKTGTITTGKLSVIKANIDNLKDEELNLLYSISDSSIHPVSIAVKKYLEENYTTLKYLGLENIKQLPSLGVQATYNNQTIFGGRIEDDKDFQCTMYHFMIDDKQLAFFTLEDTIREDAKQTILSLQEQDIRVIMCSGDNQQSVQKIAKEVGITEFKYKMSPLDKANFINKIKEDGNTVVMAGDGINDALALSKADISIAMGNGADIAIGVSDIVILNDKLSGIEKSFYISNRTFHFIKMNLGISLMYNIITIPLALAGYVIPLVAALSMSLSSLLVVGNSMRIKNNKFKGR
jgi:Cu+-exporting ATPase